MQWFWQVKNKSAITRLVLTFLTTICIIRPKIRFVCMLLYFWSRCLAKTIQYKELWCSYSFYKTGESWLWPRPYWENLSCLVSTYWYHHIFYVRNRLESSQIYHKDTKSCYKIYFRSLKCMKLLQSIFNFPTTYFSIENELVNILQHEYRHRNVNN